MSRPNVHKQHARISRNIGTIHPGVKLLLKHRRGAELSCTCAKDVRQMIFGGLTLTACECAKMLPVC